MPGVRRKYSHRLVEVCCPADNDGAASAASASPAMAKVLIAMLLARCGRRRGSLCYRPPLRKWGVSVASCKTFARTAAPRLGHRSDGYLSSLVEQAGRRNTRKCLASVGEPSVAESLRCCYSTTLSRFESLPPSQVNRAIFCFGRRRRWTIDRHLHLQRGRVGKDSRVVVSVSA
jgi:hypothetical protein